MIKVAFLMDDIDAINPAKDTSFRIALEAQREGWQIHYVESNSLFFDRQLKARGATVLQLTDRARQYCRLSAPQTITVNTFDVLFLRSDPPFDANYLYRTQLLDLVQDEVLIINHPTSVRSLNEKLFALYFAAHSVNTLITREMSHLRQFLTRYQKIVIKPLDSMGGNGVFIVEHSDPNASVIFETQTHFNQQLVMAQQYLPEISAGDKRILLIDGKPVAYVLARIPADGESRGNLNAGACGEVRKISDKEYQIAKQIGEYCVARGLLFVGVDLIGEKVTEINLTSPTCLREIENATGLNLCTDLLQAVKQRLSSLPRRRG